MDLKETYFVFCITLIILAILGRWYSNKLYPDEKKDWKQRKRIVNIIDATFLATSLWWLIASTLLSFIELF